MKRLSFFLFGILAMAVGCGDDGGAAGGGTSGAGGSAGTPGGTDAELTLEFTSLPALGTDFVYEGWLITTAGPVSSGRFTVDEAGALSQSVFTVLAADVDDTSAFVLTIEPAVGDDPAPADTHILAGDFDDGATLTIGHPAAIADDFTTAAGVYILAAPTGGMGAPFENGIWFLVPGEPPSAGLSLATLPAGWAYEGWIVDSEGPISIGRFLDPAAADSDGPGPNAGPEDAPPFPGQDFLMPAEAVRDLSTGHMAVISVEPEPDDSPAPFILKPLVHAIQAVAAPDTQTMDNNAAATSPSGTVTVSP